MSKKTPPTSENPPKRTRITQQPETPESFSGFSQPITSFFAPSPNVLEASRNRYSSSSLVDRPIAVSAPIFNSNDVSRTEVFGVVSVNIGDTQMLHSGDVEASHPSIDNIHNIHKELNEELQQELQRSSALVGEIFVKFKDRLKTENEILNAKNDALTGLVESIRKECKAIKERQENCEKLLEANGREYDEKIVRLKTDYGQKIDKLAKEIAELKSIINQHFPQDESSTN